MASGNGGWITACASLFVLGCFVGATADRVMVSKKDAQLKVSPSESDGSIIAPPGFFSDDPRAEPSFTAPAPSTSDTVVASDTIAGSGTVQSVTGDMVKVHIPDGDFTATLRLMPQTVGPRNLSTGDKIDFEGRISADRTLLEAVSITRLPSDAVLKGRAAPPRPE